MKKALIIAAHPDDEVLGCGGIISKYGAAGASFKVVFVGEGSSCRYDDPASVKSRRAIAKRTANARAAMSVLGVSDCEFHDLPCGCLDQVPILSINKIIEAAIHGFEPDTVLTHASSDANNDHRIVFDATVMATRPGVRNRVLRVLSYEVLTASEWRFVNTFAPNYFEEIAKRDLENKWRALSAYETEVKSYPFPRSKEGVRALAMTRGMQAGCAYAEAFQLIRELRT